MASQRERQAADLVSATFDFYRRRLWEKLEAADGVALHIPTEPGPCIASIMGQGGEEFGLLLFRGPKALAHYRSMLASTGVDEDLSDSVSQISFSMRRLGDIPMEARGLLEEAKFTGRREVIAPLFMCKHPGRKPRTPNATEARTLHFVIRGILHAADKGLLRPRSVVLTDNLITLTLSGTPRSPEVQAKFEPFPSEPVATAPEGVAGLDLEGLPRLKTRWLIGEPVLPVGIAGEERTLRGLLVVDGGTGRILKLQAFVAPDPRELVGEISKTLRGDNSDRVRGLPERIVVSSRSLFDSVSPALAAAGVSCDFEPDLPVLRAVMDAFEEEFGKRGGTGAVESRSPEELPDDDDLQAWKDADRALIERFVARVDLDSARSRRALKTFFGDARKGAEYLDRYKLQSSNIAFLEWYVTRFRAVQGGPTLAEQLLAGPLPPAERRLLVARVDARASLHRVDAIEQGEWVEIVDVLSGQRHRIHDRRFSECIRTDICLPALTHPAGNFHFLLIAGPALAPIEVDHAVRYLEQQGLRMTREDLDGKPEILGRLWRWREEWERHPAPVKLQNTDSEDLLWHTASFRVQDEAALRKGLGARPDVDEEETDRWCWVRRGRPKSGLGDGTLLGRLQILGDELVVEVNSESRFLRALKWLEAFPGVRFLRVTTREFTQEGGSPLDDRLGGPGRDTLPPELEGLLRQEMRKMSLRWLDEPVPALGGKTPREACRTEAGRRRVALMIRTMPRMSDDLGPESDVPRQEMLRELGIEDGA